MLSNFSPLMFIAVLQSNTWKFQLKLNSVHSRMMCLNNLRLFRVISVTLNSFIIYLRLHDLFLWLNLRLVEVQEDFLETNSFPFRCSAIVCSWKYDRCLWIGPDQFPERITGGKKSFVFLLFYCYGLYLPLYACPCSFNLIILPM